MLEITIAVLVGVVLGMVLQSVLTDRAEMKKNALKRQFLQEIGEQSTYTNIEVEFERWLHAKSQPKPRS